MTAKTFTIAGYSNLNGRVKLRVATGSIARRTAVLKSAGHTDINLVELPQPMTRAAATEYVEAQFKGVELFRSKVAAVSTKAKRELTAADFTAEEIAAAGSLSSDEVDA